MSPPVEVKDNRFQDFFEDRKYTVLKNYLYNYLLRRRAVGNALKHEKLEMVLEVGSGISPVTLFHKPVVFTDLSFLALKTLRNDIGDGFYVAADGTKLPFKSDIFSHVIASEVIEHIEDDQKAIREMGRVIRPLGVLFLTFPHRHFYFGCDDRFVNHFRRYELSEMTERIHEAGFTPVIIQKVLGPIEKITMCAAIFCFSRIQNLFSKDKTKKKYTILLVIFAVLFKWMNRFYAGLAWLDAKIMPRFLSTVLLIKSVKK